MCLQWADEMGVQLPLRLPVGVADLTVNFRM